MSTETDTDTANQTTEPAAPAAASATTEAQPAAPTPAPATTTAPAAPGAPRSFSRGIGNKANKTATAAGGPAAGGAATGAPAGGPAAPEQKPSGLLAKINFDAALAHTSDGLHLGTITAVKPTKGQRGIFVGLRHKDGANASALFMMFRVEKDEFKKPKLDAQGNEVVVADLAGQKAWAEFAVALGHKPSELTQSILDYEEAKTGDKPPIIGLDLMWDFTSSVTSSGNFLNGKFNGPATAAMLASGDAD